MRRFVRHPIDVRLEFCFIEPRICHRSHLRDISHGGLSFRADHPLPIGAALQLTIYLTQHDPFRTRAVVVWCRPCAGCCEVGVCFEGKCQMQPPYRPDISA